MTRRAGATVTTESAEPRLRRVHPPLQPAAAVAEPVPLPLPEPLQQDFARPGVATWQSLLRLLRPHQWIKNGFVLLGLVFSHRWGDAALLQSVGLALTAFCAMASAVYVYNDLIDVASDRRHPTKRLRPIASGAVSPSAARWACGALVLLGAVCAAAVSGAALALLASYAAINVAYSHGLKHMVIIDVFVISAGFMLRILVGSLGVGIPPSSWLLLCGMMATLFLGFAKRRAELLAVQGDGTSTGSTARPVLDHYRPEVLDQLLSLTGGCTVLSYALYTVSPETVALHHTDKLIYTVPFLVYGIARYLLLLHGRGSGQDTARDVLTDVHLLATALAWFAVTLTILASRA
jgi:4-hydroxybenzoate polyprenyltransferase